MSKGAIKADLGDANSCESPVCYEAHMELVSALLERGQFERWAVHSRCLTMFTPSKEEHIMQNMQREG